MAKAKKKFNINTHIRSAIRKIWMWSPIRREALKRAKVGPNKYKCENPECGKIFPLKEMHVDHIEKVTPNSGITKPEDWGLVIKAMLFITIDDLLSICKPCHKVKTDDEKAKTKAAKAALKSGDVGRSKRADTSGAGKVVSKSSRRPRKKGTDKPE